MDNVYDIKQQKKLNFILPMNYRIENVKKFLAHCNAVVVIHLHYLDTVNLYLEYVKKIPDNIDIIFTTAVNEIEEKLNKSIVRRNCKIISKQNRGRDVSALLVTCRTDILKYDYVCFLHDKKEHQDLYKEDTEKWVQCLWKNMVGSAEFINNLLLTFETNNNLGLLVPPVPISDHFSLAYTNRWGDNFRTTQLLAKKLKLECNLNPDKTPITLGTVFWAKVNALKKLFDLEWKYEDFDEEPLKDDGTISHAIERILAYVAQDAGFETGWVMADEYASERFEYDESVLKKAFYRLNLSAGIFLIAELDNYDNRLQELLNFIKKYKRIYIYGAGICAKRCFAMLKNEEIFPDAFLVSDRRQNTEFIGKVPVYSIDQIELNDECGIIIGVGEQYQEAVLQVLNNKNFFNTYIYEKIMEK